VDLKTGGIVAAVAFVLSFLIGLVSQSTMPFLIIWPLVFAAVFFVLVNVAKFLLGQFLPELLDEGDSGSNAGLFPGAVVNIVEGDTSIDDEFSSDASQGLGAEISLQASNTVANAARPDDSEKGIGDISTLSEVVSQNKAAHKETSAGVSSGMDQNMENGYTGMGDSGGFSQSALPFEAAFGAAAEAPREPSARAAAKPAKSAKSSSPAWYSTDDTLPDLDSMAGVFTSVTSDEESETANNPEPSRGKKKSANKEQTLEGDFTPKDYAKGIQTVLKKDKEE